MDSKSDYAYVDSIENTYIKNVNDQIDKLKGNQYKIVKKIQYLNEISKLTTELINKLSEVKTKRLKLASASKKNVNQTRKRNSEASKNPVNRKRTKTKHFIDEQPMYLGIGDQGKKYNGRTHDKVDWNYNNNPNTKGYRKEPDRILGNNDAYLSDNGFIVDNDEEEFESGSESGSESEEDESESGSESGSESEEDESEYGGKKNKKTLKNVKTKRSAKSRKTVRKRRTKHKK